MLYQWYTQVISELFSTENQISICTMFLKPKGCIGVLPLLFVNQYRLCKHLSYSQILYQTLCCRSYTVFPNGKYNKRTSTIHAPTSYWSEYMTRETGPRWLRQGEENYTKDTWVRGYQVLQISGEIWEVITAMLKKRGNSSYLKWVVKRNKNKAFVEKWKQENGYVGRLNARERVVSLAWSLQGRGLNDGRTNTEVNGERNFSSFPR